MEVRRKREEENMRVRGAVHTILGARRWNKATGVPRELQPSSPQAISRCLNQGGSLSSWPPKKHQFPL